MAGMYSGMKIPDHMKSYINGQLEPILEDLVTECLTTLPDDPTAFLLEFLQGQVGAKPMTDAQLAEENEKMKKEIAQLQSFADEVTKSLVGAEKPAAIQEEEEEEEDSDVDDEPPPGWQEDRPMGAPGGRQSVSAEAYGEWNKPKEFVAPVIAKTDEQKASIRPILQKSFLFSALDEKNMEIVVMAMKERTLGAGDTVIKQGDDGDFLFIVAKGTLECWKKFDGADEEKMVKTCVVGDVFGELALLYHQPRAASVKATELAVCWQLDRDTFNQIVKQAAVEKREMSMAVLTKVDLLSSMEQYDLGQLADALVSETFETDATIVKQGEPGDKFYILATGTAAAKKNGTEVMQYTQNMFFGELALLRDEPRAADVVATSKCMCLSLDRNAFKRLLGGVETLLQKKTYS